MISFFFALNMYLIFPFGFNFSLLDEGPNSRTGNGSDEAIINSLIVFNISGPQDGE